MTEVIVEKLVYIKDIPIEMLKKAIEVGELRKGKTVGLVVHKANPGEDILIDLRIEKDGQEKLISKGSVISIEQSKGAYRIV